jgi:hypothetical protein
VSAVILSIVATGVTVTAGLFLGYLFSRGARKSRDREA